MTVPRRGEQGGATPRTVVRQRRRVGPLDQQCRRSNDLKYLKTRNVLRDGLVPNGPALDTSANARATRDATLHGQYVFNVFTLELNTHVNTRIHFGPPHSEYV